MYYIVGTVKPFEQAVADLEAAVVKHGFSVLHIHDFGNTLRSKGFPFAEQCRVLEVCNPGQAARVLQTDMRLNMVLPCRISAFTEKGKTLLGMLQPAQMLAALSQDADLREIAREVEETTRAIIDEARHGG